jgi:hypothetical protein
LAGGDGRNNLLGRVVLVKSTGGVVVGPDIKRLHASQLAPLFPIVLMPLDVPPDKFEREAMDSVENFMDYVVLWTQRKDRLGVQARFYPGEEALVVRGYAEPGVRVGWIEWM